jgi:maltose/moltooligosaccharide transporter
MLTEFGIANEAAAGVIPDSIKISFIIGAIVYIVAISYTVFTTKEYSPEELKSFGEIEETENTVHIKTPAVSFNRKGSIWTLIGLLLTAGLYFYNSSANEKLEKELYVLTGGIAVFGLCQLAAGALLSKGKKNGFVEVMDDLNFLPVTMKKLAVVQFFSWFALFAMWIYSTPALAQHSRYHRYHVKSI